MSITRDFLAIEHRASVMPTTLKEKVEMGEIRVVLRKLGISLAKYPKINKALIAKIVYDTWKKMGIKCSLGDIKKGIL